MSRRASQHSISDTGLTEATDHIFTYFRSRAVISTRELLHELVDELPENQLAAAARYLEQLRANAPYDDEPLTEEELAAIDEGFADIAAGRVYSTDEVRRRLGLPPIENP
jgi:predicted transcriptional regulator